jgi:hypothetical protein
MVLKSQWDLAVAEQVSPGGLTTKAPFWSLVNSCGICGGQSVTGIGFYLCVLWFSSVITIPPTIHTHSLKYR